MADLSVMLLRVRTEFMGGPYCRVAYTDRIYRKPLVATI